VLERLHCLHEVRRVRLRRGWLDAVAEVHDMALVARLAEDLLGRRGDLLVGAVAQQLRVEVALQADVRVACIGEALLCVSHLDSVVDADDVGARGGEFLEQLAALECVSGAM